MTTPCLALDALRARIALIETAARPPHAALPFGLEAMDAALPRGGLAFGALHEVGGDGSGAAATLFVAGIVARTRGSVLWCVARSDLFAPALDQAGLDPDRVIYVEAGAEKTVLACFEEGLRHGGLGGVVAEVSRLSMTASRRLQIAAETSGAIGIALRRGPQAADMEGGQPTAAVTRWRVTPLPSTPLPVPGVGRGRWFVELTRCRAGGCAAFTVEACDETGRLAQPADLADRSAASQSEFRRASA